MAMNRERFASFLDPVVRFVYENVMNREPDVIPLVYGVHPTDQAWEKVTGIGATGLMQPWQGQVFYDDVDPLWDKLYTVQKYSIGLKIERDLWDDSQHAEIKDRVDRVTLSVYRTRQLHAHWMFNDAFAGALLTGPDGLPLCSASHPYSPSNTAVQSNTGTLAFTLDNIETTRVAMMNWTDDRGNLLLRVPDTLLVPPSMASKAAELIKSPERPDTADRAINVRQNAYKIVELPLLTQNAWFMMDSSEAKLFAKWFERRKPAPEREEDFDTETLKWKYVSRYSWGFHHWSFIYGQQGS